jgi:predicted RNA-binding protein with EMAP domain
LTFQYRLQELSSSNEENPDLSDIELIQHINVDTIRLIKLLNGEKKWWKRSITVLDCINIYVCFFQRQYQKVNY